MTLSAFLTFLLTGPGVAAVLSAIVEYVPFVNEWADGLSYNQRRLFFMGVCQAVPLMAAALLVGLGLQPNTPDKWFQALAAGWAGYLASQMTHLAIRRQEADKTGPLLIANCPKD